MAGDQAAVGLTGDAAATGYEKGRRRPPWRGTGVGLRWGCGETTPAVPARAHHVRHHERGQRCGRWLAGNGREVGGRRRITPPACAGKSAARRHEPLADGNYPRMRGEESNENAASDGMTIPSKSGFSALFPGASPRCRAIPRRGTWGLFGYQASCRGIRYASRSRIVRGPASSSSG